MASVTQRALLTNQCQHNRHTNLFKNDKKKILQVKIVKGVSLKA